MEPTPIFSELTRDRPEGTHAPGAHRPSVQDLLRAAAADRAALHSSDQRRRRARSHGDGHPELLSFEHRG